MAGSIASAEGIWLIRLGKDFRHDFTPIPLFTDNQSLIAFTKSDTNSVRMKYIDTLSLYTWTSKCQCYQTQLRPYGQQSHWYSYKTPLSSQTHQSPCYTWSSSCLKGCVMKQSWYITHMSLLHQPFVLPRSSSCHSPHHLYARPNQGLSLIHIWPFTSNTARTWNPYPLSGRRVIKVIFSHLVTISCPLISHLTHPHFTFDPSLFHIEPMLFFIFHLPFIPTLLYHPDPLCVHSDSSDHQYTIRTAIFCSYIF